MPVLFDVCIVGAYIHKSGNAFSALADGNALKKLSYLIEKHNRDALLEVSETYRTDRCNCHKKVFVKNLSVKNSQSGFFQNVIAYNKIGNKINCRHQIFVYAYGFVKDDCDGEKHG